MSSGNFVRRAALKAHGQLNRSCRLGSRGPDCRPDGDGNRQCRQNCASDRLLSFHMLQLSVDFNVAARDQNHSPGMYRSAISTDNDRSRPTPQNSAMEINDPMSSADFVDSRGRSRAIAMFMAVSPRVGATRAGDVSKDLFRDDFPESEFGFVRGYSAPELTLEH